MKNGLVIAGAALVLSACGGGGGSGGGPNGGGGQNQDQEQFVEMSFSTDNCLTSSNAEASYEFQAGTGTATHQIWSCVTFEGYSRQRVDAVFEHDGECLVLDRIGATSSACEGRAEVPDDLGWSIHPLDATVEPLYPSDLNDDTRDRNNDEGDNIGYSLIQYGGGDSSGNDYYVLNYGAEIVNTGTAPLYDLTAEVEFYGESLSKTVLSAVDFLPAGESARFHSAGYIDQMPIQAGTTYQYRIVIYDKYGELLVQAIANAKASWSP